MVNSINHYCVAMRTQAAHFRNPVGIDETSDLHSRYTRLKNLATSCCRLLPRLPRTGWKRYCTTGLRSTTDESQKSSNEVLYGSPRLLITDYIKSWRIAKLRCVDWSVCAITGIASHRMATRTPKPLLVECLLYLVLQNTFIARFIILYEIYLRFPLDFTPTIKRQCGPLPPNRSTKT